MLFTELQEKVEGRSGRIYIARQGTVTVYEMSDGSIYLINNQLGATWVGNPAESYWAHSINWQAPPYMYWMYGVKPDDGMQERAEMSIPMTKKWEERIDQRVRATKPLLK